MFNQLDKKIGSKRDSQFHYL